MNPEPLHSAKPISLPKLMGILNVTPDSFSDGGQFTSLETATAHALQMALDGASIIDIGGESTRPGAKRVSPKDQIARTAPAIHNIRATLDENNLTHVIISIDTTHAVVAEAAIENGATFINDVSAGTEDPAILNLAAEHNLPICLMHMQGAPGNMQANPTYQNVTQEVLDFLLTRADLALSLGIPHHHIYLDPGIGFGKTPQHNLQLLADLDQFTATSFPILLGVSHKSLFKHTSPTTAQNPEDREPATNAVSALATTQNVAILRVHNLPANLQAIQTTHAILNTNQA